MTPDAFTPAFRAANPVEVLPLAKLTTMRIGGPATVVTLNRAEDLGEVLGRGLRWLGSGANLLVSDEGVPGGVLRLGDGLAGLEIDGGRVRAGAGLDLATLIAACVQAGLAGPEGLAGVPATVGGALRMNAGTVHCWMLDWVARVQVVLPGERAPRWLERSELPAGYRRCGLGEGALFLACELELGRGDPQALRRRAGELKQAKARTQPLALPSAGCVFRNPRPDLPAGRLIDELGLKGTRVGGAVVSPIHANFIVNERRAASAADVAALIRIIRARAWQERGVVLDLEVEDWGMPDDLRRHPAGATATALAS